MSEVSLLSLQLYDGVVAHAVNDDGRRIQHSMMRLKLWAMRHAAKTSERIRRTELDQSLADISGNVVPFANQCCIVNLSVIICTYVLLPSGVSRSS